MNRTLKLLCGGLAAALFALPAAAQVACAKARDPQRCESLQKAKEFCKDKAGAAEKRKCMLDAMPPMDCGKARNPQRCEAMQKAKEACKDTPAAGHRQCMREHMPKRDGKARKRPA